MSQSYFEGSRGGSAELRIFGRDACSFCVSDVKKMALELELEQLTVFQPSGVIKFDASDAFLPIKKGGLKW